MRARNSFALIGLVLILGCSSQTVGATNTGSTGGRDSNGRGSTGDTGTGTPSTSGSTAPASPPTTSDLPGNDASCGSSDGTCEAKAACAAWAWSDPYIQQAVSDSDLATDLRLQAGSDNPSSTNARAGQTDSPYSSMISDAGGASLDDPSYQVLDDEVETIDSDIDAANPGDQQALQQVASDSEKLGSLCTSQHLLQPSTDQGTK